MLRHDWATRKTPFLSHNQQHHSNIVHSNLKLNVFGTQKQSWPGDLPDSSKPHNCCCNYYYYYYYYYHHHNYYFQFLLTSLFSRLIIPV